MYEKENNTEFYCGLNISFNSSDSDFEFELAESNSFNSWLYVFLIIFKNIEAYNLNISYILNDSDSKEFNDILNASHNENTNNSVQVPINQRKEDSVQFDGVFIETFEPENESLKKLMKIDKTIQVNKKYKTLAT